MKQYFSASNIFVYPSANAKDSGSENSEKNLALITDKFTTMNFIVRNKSVPIDSDTSLGLSVNDNGHLVINAGACVINGYYVKTNGVTVSPYTVIKTLPEDFNNVLYTVLIRLHHDASGLVRGDSDTTCYGVSYDVIDTQSEKLPTDNTYIKLGTIKLNNDSVNGWIFDKNTISTPPGRFAFIDSDTIRNKSNQTMDEAIQDALSKLSELNAKTNMPEDSARLWIVPGISEEAPYGTIMFRPSLNQAAYNIFDKLPKFSEKGSTTLSGTIGTQTKTNNGHSTEMARADHDHDPRYILNGSALSSDITEQLIESKLRLTKPLTTSSVIELTKTGILKVRKFQLLNAAGSAALCNMSNEEKLWVFRNRDIEIHDGQLTVAGLFTARAGINVTGNIEASGTITGSKVYNAVWNDYAELYKKHDPSKEYEPGTVICKVKGEDTYDDCTKDNRKLVVGVVSDSYGHLLGGDKGKSLEENLKNYIPVALSGRVRVKVEAGVRVEEGDLLCASTSTRGTATTLSNIEVGTIIGKALESSNGSKDKILIQVMLG